MVSELTIGKYGRKFIERSESIKSRVQHLKLMNNKSIVRVEISIASAIGLYLIALATSPFVFAQNAISNMSSTANETAGNMTASSSEAASNMSGTANETAGNITGGGNQSEGGNPLSDIPIIGDLLTGGK
jgi:hypothetical protein